MENETPRKPNGLLATLGTTLLVAVLVVAACVGVHAGMERVYNTLEDKCVLSVCLDRHPAVG